MGRGLLKGNQVRLVSNPRSQARRVQLRPLRARDGQCVCTHQQDFCATGAVRGQGTLGFKCGCFPLAVWLWGKGCLASDPASVK